jgi:hypothetical protein
MAIRIDEEEEPEAQEFQEQAQVAADAIRATVLRLLRDGEVHPHLIVLAAVRVAGELSASAALAAGEDVEAMLRYGLGAAAGRAGSAEDAAGRDAAGGGEDVSRSGFLDRWSQPTNGCCRSPVTRAAYASPT